MTANGLDAYLNSIGRLPVLTEEAQLRHCRRIHPWVNWPGGREAAPRHITRAGRRSMDVMMTTNLRLVVSVARRYQSRGLDIEDLIQEGNIGLIRGLELYDPTRGYRFSTYAYWWIRQAMTRALHTRARLIRLPINTFELLYKAQRVQAEHLSKTGSPLPLPELAALLNVTPERLATVYDVSAATECFSLDAPLESDGSTYLDVSVIDTPTVTIIPDLPAFLELLANPQRAQRVLTHLSPQEQLILQGLYFEDRTTRSLADELALSQHQIRQIAARACRTLRPLLADCTLP